MYSIRTFEIEKSFALFLCLFDGAELIVTIAINKLTEEDCELRAVYLLEQYHGKGLGTEAAEKSTVYLIGILILALKMALYQFFKFKSL